MHQNTSPSIVTKKNTKYVSFDGYFEAVYSYNGKLLKEGDGDIDMGTYNYSPSTKGGIYMFFHLIEDMITYGFYKNTKSELHENIVSAKNKLKKEVTDGEKF